MSLLSYDWSKKLKYRAWLHRMGLLETDDIILAAEYNYIKPRKW